MLADYTIKQRQLFMLRKLNRDLVDQARDFVWKHRRARGINLFLGGRYAIPGKWYHTNEYALVAYGPFDTEFQASRAYVAFRKKMLTAFRHEH